MSVRMGMRVFEWRKKEREKETGRQTQTELERGRLRGRIGRSYL